MWRVTVGAPCYNKIGFVEKSIEGILAQEDVDFEIIIIDDVSTDGSFELVKRKYATHPKIRIERNPKNLGPSGTFNRALELGTGTLFVLVSADDFVVDKLALAKQVEVFAQKSGIVLVHTDWVDLNPTGQAIGKKHFRDYICSGQDELQALLVGNHINSSGTMYSREVLIEIGGFANHLPFTSDWDAHMQVCSKGNVAHIGQCLYARTILPGSLSANVDLQSLQFQIIETIERGITILKLSDSARVRNLTKQAYAFAYIQVAQHAVKHARLKEARQLLWRARKEYPTVVLNRRFMALWLVSQFPFLSKRLLNLPMIPWRKISLLFLDRNSS